MGTRGRGEKKVLVGTRATKCSSTHAACRGFVFVRVTNVLRVFHRLLSPLPVRLRAQIHTGKLILEYTDVYYIWWHEGTMWHRATCMCVFRLSRPLFHASGLVKLLHLHEQYSSYCGIFFSMFFLLLSLLLSPISPFTRGLPLDEFTFTDAPSKSRH